MCLYLDYLFYQVNECRNFRFLKGGCRHIEDRQMQSLKEGRKNQATRGERSRMKPGEPVQVLLILGVKPRPAECVRLEPAEGIYGRQGERWELQLGCSGGVRLHFH